MTATSHHSRTLGVGTQLKLILANHGIKDQKGCGCQGFATEMNERGVEWCENHTEIVVERLLGEANRRDWPLLSLASSLGLSGVADTVMRAAAKRFVNEAIAQAKANGAS